MRTSKGTRALKKWLGIRKRPRRTGTAGGCRISVASVSPQEILRGNTFPCPLQQTGSYGPSASKISYVPQTCSKQLHTLYPFEPNKSIKAPRGQESRLHVTCILMHPFCGRLPPASFKPLFAFRRRGRTRKRKAWALRPAYCLLSISAHVLMRTVQARQVCAVCLFEVGFAFLQKHAALSSPPVPSNVLSYCVLCVAHMR